MPQVVDALDQAFDQSFATAPQTNQRFYLGIDVSSSMGGGEVAVPRIPTGRVLNMKTAIFKAIGIFMYLNIYPKRSPVG